MRSRNGLGASGSPGARPLPGSGVVPASVDSVGPQEQVADEVGHEDEEQPPDPPRVVRLKLAELDDGEIEGEGERQEEEPGREAEHEEDQHVRIVYEP